MSDELKVAIEAAKAGAKQALKYFDQDISTEFKEAYFGFGNIRHIENRDALIKLVDTSASSRSWEVTYANFLLAQGKVDNE